MADNVKVLEDSTTRGTDWEVVSLTASAYAAAPGPENANRADENKNKVSSSNEGDSYQEMFMSGHFVFPPSEHENLPIQFGTGEIQKDGGGEDVNPSDEITDVKDSEEGPGKKYDDALPVIHLYDTEGDLPVHGIEFVEDADAEVQCSNSSNASLDSLDKRDALEKNDGSGFPYDARWRRQLASCYNHMKEGSMMCSVLVAAALMGVIIIGRFWQREDIQLRLKGHFDLNAEKLNWMTKPISRIKNAFSGGRPSVRIGSASSRPGPR